MKRTNRVGIDPFLTGLFQYHIFYKSKGALKSPISLLTVDNYQQIFDCDVILI